MQIIHVCCLYSRGSCSVGGCSVAFRCCVGLLHLLQSSGAGALVGLGVGWWESGCMGWWLGGWSAPPMGAGLFGCILEVKSALSVCEARARVPSARLGSIWRALVCRARALEAMMARAREPSARLD